MFLRRHAPRLETERMVLRLPAHQDFAAWTGLRAESRDFLTPWEPAWHEGHLSRRAFVNRVYWAARASRGGTALPLFLVRHDGALVGAVTLDNIRRPVGVFCERHGQQRLERRRLRCGKAVRVDGKDTEDRHTADHIQRLDTRPAGGRIARGG